MYTMHRICQQLEKRPDRGVFAIMIMPPEEHG